MENERFAEYMAYIGVEIQDVSTFFRIVAGGHEKEIDFDHFVNGCMGARGAARAIQLAVSRLLRCLTFG